jgi:predicted RNA binding protein YcfA (HicA-like mRNA interferase family)
MKYNDLFKILRKDGWYSDRQKGSHVIMKHPIKKEQLTVLTMLAKKLKRDC